MKLGGTFTLLGLVVFCVVCEGNVEPHGDLKDILNRLNDLEHKVKTSNENYNQLQEKMAVYEKINADLSAELKHEIAASNKKDDVIKSLVTELDTIKEKIDVLEAEHLQQLKHESDVGANTDRKKDVPQSASPHTEFGDKRESRFVLDQGEAVAFHAVVGAGSVVPHSGINQTVVFETVLLNINNGYHSHLGLFVAPTAGLYIFSTSVLDGDSKPLIHADLVKNGNALARAYGHGNGGYPEQGSVTVVTQLNAGDEVWVRLSCCQGSPVTGNRYTSFTGALLMLM
ncbi:multimerin-2-like [Ruditapes philippinarum]|uniref:multimerin-2-like n=1 Tax=Ruditapes philippinarum TaxID=129788 RepID=UPI00295B6448|nr:multimerin-2-like [Ruditapes philippinarum]